MSEDPEIGRLSRLIGLQLQAVDVLLARAEREIASGLAARAQLAQMAGAMAGARVAVNDNRREPRR